MADSPRPPNDITECQICDKETFNWVRCDGECNRWCCLTCMDAFEPGKKPSGPVVAAVYYALTLNNVRVVCSGCKEKPAQTSESILKEISSVCKSTNDMLSVLTDKHAKSPDSSLPPLNQVSAATYAGALSKGLDPTARRSNDLASKAVAVNSCVQAAEESALRDEKSTSACMFGVDLGVIKDLLLDKLKAVITKAKIESFDEENILSVTPFGFKNGSFTNKVPKYKINFCSVKSKATFIGQFSRIKSVFKSNKSIYIRNDLTNMQLGELKHAKLVLSDIRASVPENFQRDIVLRYDFRSGTNYILQVKRGDDNRILLEQSSTIVADCSMYRLDGVQPKSKGQVSAKQSPSTSSQ